MHYCDLKHNIAWIVYTNIWKIIRTLSTAEDLCYHLYSRLIQLNTDLSWSYLINVKINLVINNFMHIFLISNDFAYSAFQNN